MLTVLAGKLTNAPWLSGVVIGSLQEKPTLTNGKPDGVGLTCGEEPGVAELATGAAAWLQFTASIARSTAAVLMCCETTGPPK
jgi:hypothetical protein